MQGNFGFASRLLDTLKKYNNTCPVVLSSSIQATLIGRYDSDYGRSKKAGEELFFAYGEETGAKVFVYRFPNLFGKWCRPNYNSAVATFCNNIANDLPIQVNDRAVQLELLYIDDLLDEMTQSRTHMCAVSDDAGRVIGIITVEDILEELVGEIMDEDDVGQVDSADNAAGGERA